MQVLVGGFNPSEKYENQNGFIFPNFRGENKKCLKPPPRGWSFKAIQNASIPQVRPCQLPPRPLLHPIKNGFLQGAMAPFQRAKSVGSRIFFFDPIYSYPLTQGDPLFCEWNLNKKMKIISPKIGSQFENATYIDDYLIFFMRMPFESFLVHSSLISSVYSILIRRMTY